MKSIVMQLKSTLSVGRTFTALRYPNFRLWFLGQIVSLFGTWMQNTAQGFLVYELTNSPIFLGYIGFATGIPTWIFMLYGGWVSDRLPRRTLLLITQTVMMILAFILAALVFAGLVRPWHIIILAFMLGVANSFDTPARMAFVSELVDREDLTNAIALNSGMFNTATIVGPALAGITYAVFGPAWCFALNGLSFLAVISALWRMKLPSQIPAIRHASILTGLKEGFSYVKSEPIVRTLILIVGCVSLFGMSFGTLLPAWAVEVLGGDVRTNGLLRSAQGLGALISALSIASLGRFKFRGKLLTIGTFTFPVLLFTFATIRWTPLALLALVGVGFTVVLIVNLANSLVQTTVPDELRGRVMSIYSLVFFGFFPVGALMIGTIAEYKGGPFALYSGSLILFVCAILVSILVPKVRRLE